MTKSVRTLTAVEAAWLAGVIDGEGSIGLYMKVRLDRDISRIRTGRTVIIQMGNTCRAFVERMREVIGTGSAVHRCKAQPSRKGKLPMFKYTLEGSARCRAILQQILPFLIIKKAKAMAILMELETKPFGRWVGDARVAAVKAASIKTRDSWKDPTVRKRRLEGQRKAYA